MSFVEFDGPRSWSLDATETRASTKSLASREHLTIDIYDIIGDCEQSIHSLRQSNTSLITAQFLFV